MTLSFSQKFLFFLTCTFLIPEVSHAQISPEIKQFIQDEGSQFNLAHAKRRQEIASQSTIILVSNDKISIIKGNQKQDFIPEGMDCFHNYKSLAHNLVVPLVQLSGQGTLSDDYRSNISRLEHQFLNLQPKTKDDKKFLQYFYLGLMAQKKLILTNDFIQYNKDIAPFEHFFIDKAVNCQLNGLIKIWENKLKTEVTSEPDKTYIAILTSSQAQKGNAQFQFFSNHAGINKNKIFFITDEFENEEKIKNLIAVKIFDKMLGEQHYSSSQKLERDLLEIPFKQAIEKKSSDTISPQKNKCPYESH